MELCVQLAIIFVGKQFMMSIVEYYLPMFWKLYNSFKLAAAGGKNGNNDKSKTPQWVRDFKLAEWGHQGLFYEYLEMGNVNTSYIADIIKCLTKNLHLSSDSIWVCYDICVSFSFGTFFCPHQQHFRAEIRC